MFLPSLQAPDESRLRAALRASAKEPLGVEPGSTDGPCPDDLSLNAASVRVGDGAADFAAARRAVFELQMFALQWLRVAASGAIAIGTDIALAGRVFGCWWTNVCRVVRVVDTPHAGGFVYATLRTHMMAGEERFVATLRDDGVWFEVLAHARPVHALARSGWPLVRRMQRRFAAQAAQRVAAAVAAARS